VKQGNVLNAARRLCRDILKVRSFASHHCPKADDGIESSRSGQEICGLGEFKGTGAVHDLDVTWTDAATVQTPFRACTQFSGNPIMKAADDDRDLETAARISF
jgi:hypothetical protein